MQLRARESVFWPRISADILQTAQSCKVAICANVCLLPTRTLMQSPHELIVREQMIVGKDKSSELYNRSAKDLHPFSVQQNVFVQVNPQLNRWTPAVVTRVPVASQPRSYNLEPQMEPSCKGATALMLEVAPRTC